MIENVRSYKITEEDIIILGDDFYMFNGTRNSLKSNRKHTNIQSDKITECKLDVANSLDFEKNEFRTFKVDNSFALKILDNEIVITNPEYSKGIYNSISAVKENREIWRMSYKNGLFIENIENENILILEKETLGANGNGVLHYINTNSGYVKWSFNLTKNATNANSNSSSPRYDRPIILHRNNFLIKTSNAWIFLLNSETGEIKWKTKLKVNSGTWRLDQNIAYIFNPSHYFLQIEMIDIISGKSLGVSSITDGYLKKYRASANDYEVKNGKIYWYDSKDFIVGIYDIETKKVLETFQIPKQNKKSWQIGQIGVKDNNIYIMEYLEKSKNLHILEYKV